MDWPRTGRVGYGLTRVVRSSMAKHVRSGGRRAGRLSGVRSLVWAGPQHCCRAGRASEDLPLQPSQQRPTVPDHSKQSHATTYRSIVPSHGTSPWYRPLLAKHGVGDEQSGIQYPRSDSRTRRHEFLSCIELYNIKKPVFCYVTCVGKLLYFNFHQFLLKSHKNFGSDRHISDLIGLFCRDVTN